MVTVCVYVYNLYHVPSVLVFYEKPNTHVQLS